MSAVPSVLAGEPQVSGTWAREAVNIPITAGPLEPGTGYPGAVQTNHADKGKLPANVAGPTAGATAAEPFADESVYWAAGGYVSSPELTHLGHQTAYPPAEANHGQQFAGSGPVAAGYHSDDDGGTFLSEHEGMPDVGHPWRNTVRNQAMDYGVVYDPTGKRTNFTGDRVALDQYTGNHANRIQEHQIPYGERPIYLNIATTAQPITSPGGAYSPSGGHLTDMANNQAETSVIYVSPPDPYAATTAVAGPQYVPGSEFA